METAIRIFSLEPGRIRRWAGYGVWSVADQGLFAGTHFIVNILLARWLDPVSYGAFSTAYAVFLLLATFHTALWAEPMLVFGPGWLRSRFATYQTILARYHWMFGGLVVLGFGAIGGLLRGPLGQPDLGWSFLGLALAAPPVLFLWLVRRGAYAVLEPRLAAWGGGLYLVLYLGGIGGLAVMGRLSEGSAFVAMGLAALVAGLWVFAAVQRHADGLRGPVEPTEVVARHWAYGRWTLVGGLAAWVPANVYFVLLPVLAGLEATAQFKALFNLVMPILHLNAALGGLLVPLLVRARQDGMASRYIRLFLLGRSGLSLLYWGGLFLVGDTTMGFFYGDRYPASGLSWLALVALAEAVYTTYQSALLAQERPHRMAWAFLLGALVALPLSLLLIRAHGVIGAVIAMVAVKFVLAGTFAWLGHSRPGTLSGSG